MSGPTNSGAVAIIIPAYKPSPGLVQIVQDVAASGVGPVIVVDDGGGEAFARVFQQVKEVPGVSVVANAVNLGKGAALKNGINYALTHFGELVGVVTADADGQHKTADILKVANALTSGKGYGLVLGYREFGKEIPLRSRVGNNISRVVYRLLLGLNLRDTQTGLRGLSRAFAERSLAIRSNRYEFETEQLALVPAAGVMVGEIPIETIYEDDNASSHFDPLFDSFRIYFVVLRYAFSSAVTALVDLAVFVAVVGLMPNLIAATLASRAVALIVQFLFLRSFVFHTKAGLGRFILFVGYVALTGLASGALQEQLGGWSGVNVVAGKLLVETAIFVFNFLFLRTILFARREV